jgi:hypothetical protein
MDLIIDMLRLGASAEVANTWAELAEWARTTKDRTPEGLRLRKAFQEALDVHEANNEALAEYMGRDADSACAMTGGKK